jgi:hypothetical protein
MMEGDALKSIQSAKSPSTHNKTPANRVPASRLTRLNPLSLVKRCQIAGPASNAKAPPKAKTAIVAAPCPAPPLSEASNNAE